MTAAQHRLAAAAEGGANSHAVNCLDGGLVDDGAARSCPQRYDLVAAHHRHAADRRAGEHLLGAAIEDGADRAAALLDNLDAAAVEHGAAYDAVDVFGCLQTR
jgi:hypothetical protein